MEPARTATVPRVRPRDRKQQIQDAAALAFARHGYHPVGMQDIAAAVGISAPALYRHFPNKYALFVRTAFALVQRLIEATEEASVAKPETPEQAKKTLDRMLAAVTDVTIELRATGGIYRWEGRYLERDDRRRLTGEFSRLRARFEDVLAVYRPTVSERDRAMLVWAALSAIASITAHRTTVAAKSLRSLLRGAAWRVLDSDLPPFDADARSGLVRASLPTSPPPVEGNGRREQLVHAAIQVFAARGYNEATIEEIATRVELTPSGVYRHFDGKSALLLAAYDHATVELERAMLRAREASDAPDEVLRMLCAGYVDHSFVNVALMRVYFSELGNLAPDEQRRLRAVQRAHVADWSALLQGVRPELEGRAATVLVHAALNVVADHVPWLDPDSPAERKRLTAVMVTVLGLP